MTNTAFRFHIKAIFIRISNSLKFKSSPHQEYSTIENPVFITLGEARKNPALVNELHQQLDEAKIITGSRMEYVAGVKFKGHQYYITGTQNEWLSFYRMDWS